MKSLKQAIRDIFSKRKSARDNHKEFSDSLRRALGMTKKEMHQMYDCRMKIVTNAFEIQIHSVCWAGWSPLFFVSIFSTVPQGTDSYQHVVNDRLADIVSSVENGFELKSI